MPEGDSIHHDANRIREAFADRRVQRVAGTAPTVRRHARRLIGSTVSSVEAVGKHLVVEFDAIWALHVHRGMTGAWRLGQAIDPRADGPARVVIATHDRVARCHGAPTVELGRAPAIRASLASLGPDLIDDGSAGVLDRVRRDDARPIGAVLLDQRVAAGIGNVYRNEVLFEAGLHPARPAYGVDDATIVWLFERAASHLRANVGRRRTTTGAMTRDAATFVYGRAGRPCRRCGTAIRFDRQGDPRRDTFWCPACQPDVTGPPADR